MAAVLKIRCVCVSSCIMTPYCSFHKDFVCILCVCVHGAAGVHMWEPGVNLGCHYFRCCLPPFEGLSLRILLVSFFPALDLQADTTIPGIFI